MYKLVPVIVLSVFLPCITLRAIPNSQLEESPFAEQGIIKGATHYELREGYYGYDMDCKKVWNNPRASFYGYDPLKQKKEFQSFHQSTLLAEVELNTLDAKTLENLNKMLDPHAKKPEIVKGEISYCLNATWRLTFFDKNKNPIHTVEAYSGSRDIKAKKNAFKSIQPPELFNNLEEVVEYRPIIPALWFLGLPFIKLRKTYK